MQKLENDHLVVKHIPVDDPDNPLDDDAEILYEAVPIDQALKELSLVVDEYKPSVQMMDAKEEQKQAVETKIKVDKKDADAVWDEVCSHRICSVVCTRERGGEGLMSVCS